MKSSIIYINFQAMIQKGRKILQDLNKIIENDMSGAWKQKQKLQKMF